MPLPLLPSKHLQAGTTQVTTTTTACICQQVLLTSSVFLAKDEAQLLSSRFRDLDRLSAGHASARLPRLQLGTHSNPPGLSGALAARRIGKCKLS